VRINIWILSAILTLLFVSGTRAQEGSTLMPAVFDSPQQMGEDISNMQFCNAGDCIVYVDDSNHISRIDLSDPSAPILTHTAALSAGEDTVDLDVSPNDRYVRLFIPGQDGTFVWDIASNESFNLQNEVHGVDAENSYAFPRSYWHQIGTAQVLVLDNPLSNRGEIWNLTTRQRIPNIRQVPSWLSESRAVTFIRDGIVSIWNAETGALIRTITTGQLIEQIFVDKAQSRIYISNWTRTETKDWGTDLTVWDAETGEFLFSFPEIYNPYWVILSDDGSQVFIADDDTHWTLWETDTQTKIYQIESASSYPRWNADETLILTDYAPPRSSECYQAYEITCERGSSIWNAQTGELISQRPLSEEWFRGPVWMPNSQWLIDYEVTGFRIWNARTGSTVYEFHTPDWVWRAGWERLSNDGTKLIAYSGDHIYLWTISQL
jgi:WD40 repeat protein